MSLDDYYKWGYIKDVVHEHDKIHNFDNMFIRSAFMKIKSVFSHAFTKYGKILNGYDVTDLSLIHI